MSRPLVVISLEPWDDVWRRNQYLIDGLLRHDVDRAVLFVEPPADPLYELRSRRWPKRSQGVRTADGYGGRLHLLEPVKLLPRAAGPVSDGLLHAVVRRAVAGLGWRDPILWVNDPRWWQLAEATGWRTVYDITDDWTRADREPREHGRLVQGDDALLRLSREVVVCSRGLAESKGAVRPVELIPNAVDVARYRRPLERPHDLPAAPVVVYVGTLHEDRLDVELVRQAGPRVAAAGGSISLIGPDALSRANSDALRATPGVRLLGARPWGTIPAYLQHARVLAVPHVVSPFTDSLDPIKAYEYLAVGRPIVSTPVAGFRECDGENGVRIADAAAFGDELLRALRAPSAAAWPEVPDWADRVAAYDALLRRMESGAERVHSHVTS